MSGPYSTSSLDEIIAQRAETDEARAAQEQLQNPSFLTATAIAAEQENGLAEEAGLARDLLVENYDTLRQKYGQEVADQAFTLQNVRNDLADFRDDSNGLGQAVGDAALGAASAGVRFAGNTVGALAVRPLAWAAGVDADVASAVQADLTDFVADDILSHRSDRAQISAELGAIQQQLDSQDNLRTAEQEVAEGASPWMAATRMVGRNVMDAGQNIIGDSGQAQALLAESLGSLGPSAAVARGATIAASKGVRLLTQSRRANSLAQATAASVAIGATEAAGTYAQTMNEIMDMSEDQISQSSVYAGLLEEGYSNYEARVALANMTAETAFAANLPAAIALGSLTRRFETAPIGSFKGSGIIDGLRTGLAQGLEEAGQGAASNTAQALAQNEVADIETSYTEGLGEQIAQGFLGGVGQAGVVGAPGVAAQTVRDTASTARSAADALFSETTYNDPVRQDIVGGSVASRTVEGVRDAARPILEQAQKVASATGQAISPATTYVADVFRGEEKSEYRSTSQDALDLNESVSNLVVDGSLSPEATEAVSRVDTPSEGFAGIQGNNLIESIAGMTAKLGTRGFRMTEEDTAYAAAQVTRLRQVAESLPTRAKRQAGKILSSKAVQKIQSEIAKVDLNESTPTGEVTPQEISTTVNVAKINPANVNPERTDQLLEESGENISPQDLKLTRAASNVSRAINGNVDTQIEIQRSNGVTLSRSPEQPKKGKSTEQTSRSILADGFVTRTGKALPSVNDMAANIIIGLQSPNGEFTDNQGNKTTVKREARRLRDFIQHQNNKVEALNQSFDNQVIRENGDSIGKPFKYSGLANGERFYDKDSADNYFPALSYHKSRPASVALAQQIENDTRTAETVLAAIQKEFPEAFEGLAEVVPVTLKRDTQNPTAVEEETPAGGSDEQQQNNTDSQTETVSEENPRNDTDSSTETNPSQTIDEDSSSRDEEVESGSPEPVETEESSEVVSEEQIQDEDLTEENFIDEMARLDVKENLNQRRNAVRTEISETMGLSVLRKVRQIRVYQNDGSKGPGYVWYNDQTIYLSEDLFDGQNQLTPMGRAVVIHEAGHIIDYVGDPAADQWWSKGRTFYEGGQIFNEFESLKGYSEWLDDRIDMVQSYDGHDMAKEMFAVLTELQFSSYPDVFDNTPAIAQLMESIYGEREATGTGPETTEEPATVDEAEPVTSEDDGTDTVETTDEPGDYRVNPEFFNHFNAQNTEGHPKNLGDFLTKVEGTNLNSQTVEFVKSLRPVIAQALEARLNKKVKDGGVTKTVRQHILDGRTQFRRFKAGLLVNPETGQFDDAVIDMAAIAMSDWLLTNTGSDANRLEQTLEKLGISVNDVNDEDFNSILNGVPPNQAVDRIGFDMMRLLDVRENEDSAVDDLEGIIHGFAKELFTAMSDTTELLTVKKVPVTRDGREDEIYTILVNNGEMKEIRDAVRAENGPGKKLTSMEVLFGDTAPLYSVGEKLTSVARTQDRTQVQLSDVERNALRKMQDTPNYVDGTASAVFNGLDEDVLKQILGFDAAVDNIENPVLQRSVRGKNTSIESNYAETKAILSAVGNPDNRMPVFFPVGITKVGRHQYQGPNPQSNKLMRAMVTPTWSTVSVDALDNFWIAVGQASDISGINKAEKLSHAQIVADASSKFYETFGEAVPHIKNLIRSGEVDQQALADALGVVEPQQLKAVIAVAQLEIAKEDGASTFDTSLSFELDGLTNGVANMMVNFGQGELTPEDYNNFQRVGFFIGKMGETVNKFFAQSGALDMYETVSRLGDKMLGQGLQRLEPWQKAQREVSIRLAATIGNFSVDENGVITMSRNTAKNPMTKVNYGSGVRGVAVGVSDDMLLKFYEDMQKRPPETSVDDFYYPGFKADMETMGLIVSDKPAKSFVFDQEAIKNFRTRIQYTIGDTLTEATREVIGDKINQFNDLMVFSTNVQSQYLRDVYEMRLNELAEKLANEGIIKDKSKLAQIPRKYFRELERELSAMAPLFVSDDQSLAIGGFQKGRGLVRTSSNFDEQMNDFALMRLPDDVGVRSIPFSVIGSGDAMMMNYIFGTQGAPDDVLGIFDGLDIPLSKIQDYAPRVNQAVAKTWERDVMSMAIQNFRGFLNSGLDQDLLNAAYAKVLDKNKKSSVTASNPSELMVQLEQRLEANKARKKVFKQLAASVDQMGGSDVGYTREGPEASLIEINTRIARELEGKDQQIVEDVREPVFETTAASFLKSLRFTAKQKEVVSIINEAITDDTRVVLGTVDQIRDWQAANNPDNGAIMSDANGAYDHVNDIIYLTQDKPETVLHEMVHAATFKRVVEGFGNGDPAIARMQSLVDQFLTIEDGGQAVRDAQAAILRHVNQTDPTRRAMAMNEFMAYVLSNSQVRKKAEKTTVLTKLVETAKKLMRRIMGGVGSDMFSQTAFNTRVIIDPSLEASSSDGGNNNGDGGGSDGGDLTPMANNYTNYWIEKLSEYIDSLDTNTAVGLRRRRDTSKDIINADKILDDLRQAGLLRNPNDRQTFRAIYGIMKSEMVLDPNSLIALTKVFQHVEEQMSPEMFGSTPEDRQTYSAVINSFGGFKRGDTSDAVAVLFALSQTSQKFRDVMEQIPAPETAEVGSGLNAFLSRGTQIFMNKLMGSIQDGAPQEVMDGLKQTIIQSNQEKEYAILNRVTQSLDQADQYVSGKLSDAALGMRRIDAATKAETQGTLKQYLISSVTFGTNFLDTQGAALNAEAVQRTAHIGVPILSLVPIRELVDEFVGTNKDNAEFVAMMDVVNSKITGVRQDYREQLPEILNKRFSEAPVAEQWKSMQRTLGNTDFTRFVDVNNLQPFMQMLEESGVRQRQITILENQLQGMLSPSNFNDAKDKAMQLADFMNKKRVGKLLVRNAYAITKNLEGDVPDGVEALIDELTTMYAIDTMDADLREDTVQLWQNEPQAMTAIVTYIQHLNAEEDAKNVSEVAKLNGYKGYLPNVGGENHRITVALDSEEADMIHRGYRKIAPFTGDVGNSFPRSYYVTNISQQGQYSQGIMQNVSNSYRGVDPNTGLTVTGDAVGFISGEDVVNRVAEELVLDSYELEDENETLMPVFDGDNAIIGFERSINPILSDAFLGREENLAINLGAWAGRQVEEKLATDYNRALVDKLDDMWQNRETGTDDQFVNLKRTDDPIYRESFKLIPQEIKDYMDSKFDGNGPMVMESMVNLSVGYREASVADLWTGKTRMSPQLVKTVQAVTRQQFGQKSLRTLLVQGEQIGQGIISDAKDIIVIKSLIVPIANTQANIIQLSTNGVPNKRIVQGYRKKLAEITEFNKNITKLMDLRNQRRMTQNPERQKLIDGKIQVLEDLNAKMTIAPMIEAGAYKQLSEGITDLDRANTNGGLADWLEAQANKLPDTLGTLAKNGLVSKSTAIYRGANRATQYGDFLAKSIYYDHLIDQGRTPEDAIRIMNEEFVNFSALPGRTRSMLERNGLTWFMAFKIRIAKIAAKQLRENPVRSITMNSVLDTGSPIQDNIFTVIGEGRMDYATGYEMLFGAPELHPWVNLLSD
ncbi:viron-encapsulated RNA polymerase [Sulfitobacter phage vB_SupP_AX]|nr:viron-encapsulated RNA polymerase [Sulfitobacter phage vB_SupP_AX]